MDEKKDEDKELKERIKKGFIEQREDDCNKKVKGFYADVTGRR